MRDVAFGCRVLLQPERINAYAQAVIRTLQADEHQRGCLVEERVLKGDLAYESSMLRLAGDEERSVLLVVYQTLVERGRCTLRLVNGDTITADHPDYLFMPPARNWVLGVKPEGRGFEFVPTVHIAAIELEPQAARAEVNT